MANCILQSHPDWKLPFYVITDAGKVAISGIVAQFDESGTPKVLSMVSRLLKKPERNYPVHEPELLAIIYTIKKNAYLLVNHEIICRTDCRALKYLKSCGDCVSDRIARWRTYLFQFDIFAVEHIPGTANRAADALSRFRYDAYTIPTELEQVKAAVDHAIDLFNSPPAVMLLTADKGIRIDNVMESMKDLQWICPDLQALVEKNSPSLTLSKGYYYWRNRTGSERLFAPLSIRSMLIEFYHKQYTHPGIKKMIDIIRRHFDWPGSRDDIAEFVKNCHTCKQSKYRNYVLQGPLHSVVAEHPMEMLSVDIFGPIPRAEGKYNEILVIMDVFTKFTRLYPVLSHGAETCIRHIDDFIRQYQHRGTCKYLLSDNATAFQSGFCVKHWTDLNIQVRYSTGYHPQANPVETRMKIIADCLRVLCPTEHTRWIEFIKTIERRLNETVHATTGFAPTSLLLGIKFNIDGTFSKMTPTEYQQPLEQARSTTKKKLEARKLANDAKTLTKLYPGDVVYVKGHAKSDSKKGFTKKMAPITVGPCVVQEE